MRTSDDSVGESRSESEVRMPSLGGDVQVKMRKGRPSFTYAPTSALGIAWHCSVGTRAEARNSAASNTEAKVSSPSRSSCSSSSTRPTRDRSSEISRASNAIRWRCSSLMCFELCMTERANRRRFWLTVSRCTDWKRCARLSRTKVLNLRPAFEALRTCKERKVNNASDEGG